MARAVVTGESSNLKEEVGFALYTHRGACGGFWHFPYSQSLSYAIPIATHEPRVHRELFGPQGRDGIYS